MRTSRSVITAALLCAAALLIAACVPVAGGIVVKEPFSRASPTEITTGGAFMTIRNSGQGTDRLVSASSPAAKTVELHETVNENGVMKMQPRPEGFEIPAGGTLELRPGGKHIMLIDLVAPLEAGQTIEIILNFEKAGPQKIEVPVQKM